MRNLLVAQIAKNGINGAFLTGKTWNIPEDVHVKLEKINPSKHIILLFGNTT